MKKIQIIICVLLTFYLSGQSIGAEKVYVTDNLSITLRTGPSSENKIIRMVKSAQALNVIEAQEKWSRVGVLDNNEVVLEGWVRNQYLIDRTPYEIQAKALFKENGKLKGTLTKVNEKQKLLSKQKKELTIQYEQTRKELVSLRKEYEALKNSSSKYLTLKDEYESNLSILESVEQKLKELEIENAKIIDSQNYLWFGTGALVLLFGLIIGSILGRQSGKKTSSYY